MTRLQILELPEGVDDRRRPFVLVVDECQPQRIVIGIDTPWRDHWQELADKIGARGVIVVPDTVTIPTSEPPTGTDTPESGTLNPKLAALIERALGITPEEKGSAGVEAWLATACRQLEKSKAECTHLHHERTFLTRRLRQVRNLSTEPDLMNAGQEHPNIWKHGYECGVLAAKAAARPCDEETTP
ncbi:hypothetical protein [Streptomyces turgidiscabies]|uniref:hypothetical protein n=1 Tax=Streptomyces turgidiscabies TaxID=85558 RepID=UPI0038F6D326